MNYKQLLAAVTAAALLLCGCQKIDDTDVSTPQEAAVQEADGSAVSLADDALTTTVRLEELSYPDGAVGLSQITPTADGYLCIGFSSSENAWDARHVYRYDANFENPAEIVLVPPSPYDGYYYRGGLTAFAADGYYSLAVMENHSDLDLTEIESADFDWDLYDETWQSDYFLCSYAADGTMTNKLQIGGLEAYRNFQGYDQFCDLYAGTSGIYLLLMDGTILRIEENGTLTETNPAPYAPEDFAHVVDKSYILTDRDGKPVYYQGGIFTDPEGYVQETASLSDFDETTGKPGEPFCDVQGYSGTFCCNASSGGYGDYRLFITEEEQTLGIRDDGTAEVVIDWDASSLDPMDVVPLPDGSFIGQRGDKLWHIVRKHASEIKEQQTILLGVLGEDYLIKDFVKEFNGRHEDYRLQTVMYRNSDGSDFGSGNGKDDALDKLKLAIVSDNAPDLVLMYDQHEQFLKLGSKAVFCDLNELMADDAEVNAKMMLPNILAALEHPNGALYALTPGFRVASIAVKSKFTDQENWTMDDMISLYDGADDVMYKWSSKEKMLEMFLMGMDFTDEIAGTCSFDSPEFIRVLEFCDRYPMASSEPDHNKDDPVSDEAYRKWYNDFLARYHYDQDYLYFSSFGAVQGVSFSASAYAYTKADLGGDFTLVGYPSDDKQGGKIICSPEMGIVSTCQDKAGVWEVIKAFMHTEMQYDIMGEYSLFEEQFEQQLDDEMYIWNLGEKTDDEYYEDDFKVYPLTQEERDGLETYIRNLHTFMMLDGNVKNIVREEAGMYFSGDRSAEETARMIQSRAEIYLAEQN